MSLWGSLAGALQDSKGNTIAVYSPDAKAMAAAAAAAMASMPLRDSGTCNPAC